MLYTVIVLLLLDLPGKVPGLELGLLDVEELSDRNTLLTTLRNGQGKVLIGNTW